jgi:hypothetical protein
MLVKGSADELHGSPSADGRFICFQSDDTGRWDIHVLEISSGRRWIVSANAGYDPKWTRDGKQIHYRGSFEFGWVVNVTTAPEFAASTPQEIFPFERGRPFQLFDISHDGQRALVAGEEITNEGSETRPRMVVVLNWFDELRERVVSRTP